MNDTEILDQIGNLRIQLAEQTEGISGEDYARLLVAVSIFIAGVDAMFTMRQNRGD